MKTKVTVGIDARPLSSRLTGIGMYVQETLVRLVEMTPNWSWCLYVCGGELPLFWQDFDNVKVREISRIPRLSSSLVCQVVMPYWAYRDGIDIFWSPRHHLPIVMPSKIKQVVTIHDLVWNIYPETMSLLGRYLDRFLMPVAVSHADLIFSVSDSTKQDIIQVFATSKPIEIIYPASSYQNVEEFEESQFEKESYFLFVGTLEPRKNIVRVLQAFNNLVNDMMVPVKKLVIVGAEGWGREDLRQLVHDLGINDYVVFTGYVTEQVLSGLYRNALALVFPSLYEGFGMPLLEAMSLGTPVITANISSMPEVAAEAGVYVDPYSVDEIAAAMKLMAVDSSLRIEKAEKALSISCRYSWQCSAESIRANFVTLLSNH